MIEIPRFRSQRSFGGGGSVPRLSSGAATQVAQGAADLGDVLLDLASDQLEEERDARRAAKLFELNSAAVMRASELQLEFESDPDFETAPQRFAEALTGVRDELVEGLDDDTVRQSFEREFRGLAINKTIEMRRGSRKREVDFRRSQLDAALPVLAREAAQARNDLERLQIREQAEIAIGRMAAGGFITAQDAEARRQQLGSDIDQARARTMITQDPESAVLALLDSDEFAELDPVARARLSDTAVKRADAVAAERARASAKADREEEAARKKRADEFMKEIFDLDSEGELTREFIEDAREDLTAPQFSTALKLLEPDGDTVKDDRDALLEVYQEIARNPQDGRDLARQYFREGLLSNETFKSIEGNAESFEDSNFKAGSRFIERSLAPGDMIADPAQRERAAQAVDEFRAWFQLQDRTAEEVRIEQREIVRRFRLFDQGEPLLIPPQPRSAQINFIGGDLAQIEAEIEAAEDAAFDAIASGAMAPELARIEAQTLQRAKAWLDQQKRAAELAQRQARSER